MHKVLPKTHGYIRESREFTKDETLTYQNAPVYASLMFPIMILTKSQTFEGNPSYTPQLLISKVCENLWCDNV